MMNVTIKNSGNFANSAVARCNLEPGQTVNIESGSMYQSSMGVEVESKMEGGVFKALKRSILTGESFFVTKYTAPKNGKAWVDVVPAYPGDTLSFENNPQNPTILTKGVWLASEPTVELKTQMAGMTATFGGEGLFTARCEGSGTVVIAAYGAMEIHNLKEGEGFTVDTGHLVAYESSVRNQIRKVASGIMNTLKSGEGLVMDFYGPGIVITQSRNPSGFASFVSGLLGKTS